MFGWFKKKEVNPTVVKYLIFYKRQKDITFEEFLEIFDLHLQGISWFSKEEFDNLPINAKRHLYLDYESGEEFEI